MQAYHELLGQRREKKNLSEYESFLTNLITYVRPIKKKSKNLRRKFDVRYQKKGLKSFKISNKNKVKKNLGNEGTSVHLMNR